MATRRVVLLDVRDKPLNISKPSLTKKLMKVLNFARLSKREPRWQIATTLIFEVNAAFPAFCFFHAVKQVELFAKLLFGIYKYMFYRLRKFLLSKEATSHFPRNNLQHAQGRILTKRYRRLALIKIMISIS